MTLEWVSLYFAVSRLETLWAIPSSIAEEIVRDVIEGGRVEVRARRRGRFQQAFQIVTGQIQLLEVALLAADYDDIEIDWNGLDVEGRKRIPNYMVVPEAEAEKRQRRATPALDRAKLALSRLFPADLPDQVTLPNASLVRSVAKKLKEMEQLEGLAPLLVSDATILRAAGRK